MDDRKEMLAKSMDFCQMTITRMAKNSFVLKAWFLIAFTAMFTFFSRSVSGEIEYRTNLADLVWLLPMLIFPILDAYYLKQERIFRDIYDDFMESINSANNLRRPFDLKPTDEQRKMFSIFNIVFSNSVIWLYSPLLIVFQALIIFHSKTECPFLYMSVIPVLILILTLIFRRKAA